MPSTTSALAKSEKLKRFSEANTGIKSTKIVAHTLDPIKEPEGRPRGLGLILMLVRRCRKSVVGQNGHAAELF
jgi:hypothetical protein